MSHARNAERLTWHKVRSQFNNTTTVATASLATHSAPRLGHVPRDRDVPDIHRIGRVE
jgi:hypothetical protein